MKRETGWRPMAPVLTVTKGEFSFLIALGKQLERALELCYDGSAPDFLTDAVGVLANGLEGLAGQPLDGEEASGGDDDDGDDDDDTSSGMESSLASRSPGERSGVRAVGGAVVGTRPVMTEVGRVVPHMRGVQPTGRNGAQPQARTRKGGKRRGKKSAKK